MKNYSKPMVLANPDLSEGVYAAASGTSDDQLFVCESVFMNGTWQNGGPHGKTYKEKFGCEGCPAYNSNGCMIQSGEVKHEADFRPRWERQNHFADESFRGQGHR